MYRQDAFSLSAHWSVRPGAKVAILGPSGCGKSTLLSLIAGFLAPTQGRVMWAEQDLRDVRPGDRPLSILFQDQNLFPHLTLFQNLGLALRPDLRLSDAQRRMILDALARVELTGMQDRKPGQVSGGQIARAALARSLLRQRPVLLLDEPFAALGPALKSDMLGFVAEVAAESGTTVLMVTHDPHDAQSFADETVFVSDGVAGAPVPTADLFANPTQALADYLGR